MVKGQVLYKNGDQYHGEIGKNNTLQGNGIYKFKDGSLYTGQFKNNKFHGHGKLIDKFQDIIINAEFKQGKATSRGRIIYGGTHKHQNNDKKQHIRGQYQGQISNNQRNGKGKYVFHEKKQQGVYPILYEGLFEDDSFHGNGKLTFSDNSFYLGNFRNGLYDGQGQYHNKQFTYSGHFKKGIIQGQGIIKYSSGQYYKGNFINNQKNGYGQYHYLNSNKSVYLGQWKNDQKNGKGKITNENGDSYQGQFIDDKPYGQFKCIISGVQILAQLQGNILNGPISIKQKKNYTINGFYKEGKKNGVFTMEKINKYGEQVSYRGEFKDGRQLPHSISYSHRF